MPVADRKVEANVAEVCVAGCDAQEIATMPADENGRAFRP